MNIRKSRLFYIRLFTFVFIFFMIFSSFDNSVEAIGFQFGDTNQDSENFILKGIGNAFMYLAKGLYWVIGDASMDNLIYGNDTQFGGLSLFKQGEAQDFLAGYYNLFNVVAIIMFVPIVYWSIIAFTRAGDSPQGKSLLKDRLTKIVVTFVFLYTMPELMTILAKISNIFVDIFNVGGSSPVGTYIEDMFNQTDGSKFVSGATALMLVGINLWMIFFYIIRDLTVSFLFMFFPIVAIWYPLSQGMILSWWKNMGSNILTQPIHAVILSLVITMASFMNVAGMGFLGGLYMIVAFGSIIPMTGIIKGFLGLEGTVGAASSRAGLGGMVAAVGMMRMAGRNFGANKDAIKEGLEEKSILSAKSKSMDKNLDQEGIGASNATSQSEMSRPLINPSMNNVSSKHELMNQQREANKKIAKGVGSIGFGTFTGMAGAALGGGMGARVAMTTGLAGYGAGAVAGGFASKHGADLVSGMHVTNADSLELGSLQLESAKELNSEYEGMESSELRNVLNENPQLYNQTLNMGKDKLLGIYNPELTNTPQQAQLRNAMMKQRDIANAGSSSAFRHFSRQALVNGSPSFKSNEEIMKMSSEGSQVNLYQDQDMSYLYTTNSTGELEVLKRGAGVAGMTQPMNSPVNFNDSLNAGMAGDYALQYQMQAEEQAHSYMQMTHPGMTDRGAKEYKDIHLNKMKEIQVSCKHSYNDSVKSARDNFGMANLNVETNRIRANGFNEMKKATLEVEMEAKKAEMENSIIQTTHFEDTAFNNREYYDSVDSYF